MRMIDADRLYNTIIDEIDPLSISMDGGAVRGMMHTIIAAEPTVDAVPVTHGKWRKPMKNYYVQCNLCGRSYEIDSPQPNERWSYCPGCGAKMDLEDTP